MTPFQVVLAVSYHAEILQQEMDLEAARLGIKITFAHETEPLGKNSFRIEEKYSFELIPISSYNLNNAIQFETFHSFSS